MSLDLQLLVSKPFLVLALAVGLVAVKAAVLYRLGRAQGLPAGAARRLGISLSQGGEFGFVLFAVGVGAGVMSQQNADLLAVVVTLSMAATPSCCASIRFWRSGGCRRFRPTRCRPPTTATSSSPGSGASAR